MNFRLATAMSVNYHPFLYPNLFSAGTMTPKAVKTVLLVDDDHAVCRLLQHALTEAGYHVLVANDGQSALTIFENRADAIHVLITDLQMPILGGLDLAHDVLQKQPTRPIIFISGTPETAQLPTLDIFPKHVFLEKPFLPSTLLAILPTLLT